MNKLDFLQLAQQNLWRRKVRTILTTLGVVIGTTSIVVMMSLGIGLNENQRKNMERWGSLTIIRIQQGMVFDDQGQPVGEAKSLNDEAVAELKSIEGVRAVSPIYNIGGEARLGQKRGGIQLVGLDPVAMPELEFTAAAGRLLAEGDRAVMVVGKQVIENFWNERDMRRRSGPMMMVQEQDPLEMLDKRVTMTFMNSQQQKKIFNFQVVGILEGDRNEHSYQAYVPLAELKKMRSFINAGSSQRISQEMIIKGASTRAVASTRAAARTTSRNERNSNNDDYSSIMVSTNDLSQTRLVSQEIKDRGYNCWSMADQLEGVEKSSRIIQGILGGIGGIALLVASLGITNTMIMSIYERTKEIGIMKVMGASFTDVYTLFLVESGLIGFLGGTTGVLFSYGVSHIINHFAQGYLQRGMPQGEEAISFSLIPPWLALFALGFAVLIGLVAGLYPAYRAVQLSPINAIRGE